MNIELLKDQVCVVTGGGSGIGEATAKLFAQEGAKLCLIDISMPNMERVKKEIGDESILCCKADLTKEEELLAAFNQIISVHGKIDSLVACAGILDYHSYILKCSRELWDYTININQTSVFRCCREALKYMVPAQKGTIIIISSLAAVAGSSGAAYTASKFAVVGLCKNIATEYATKGIRCNCVCPGETDTPLNHPSEKWIKTSQLYADDDFCNRCFAHNRSDVPMCTAEDQAKTCLFLASDLSSGITGQSFQVDRGMYINDR